MRKHEIEGMGASPGEVARTWLRAWDTGDLTLLRLTPDFVHTSPFGRIQGAEEYLRIVEPMSKRSVVGITVRDVLEGEGRAAIAYELETTAGKVDACDWIFVDDAGRIREIMAYYDSATNREALRGGPDRYPDAGLAE
jgi:hypothetical protein